MTAPALALVLVSLSRAAWFGDAPSVQPAKQLFAKGRYDQVITELGEEGRLERMTSADQREGYLYLGMAYERAGRADRAVGVYQLGVSLFPNDVNLLTQLAQVLHTGGLEEQAAPIFQKILTIHPNNAAAHLGLAEIDQRLGFYDRGAEHFEKALKQMADNPRVWREYGENRLSSNHPERAEALFQRSLVIKDTVESRAALAAAQRAQGRLDQALQTISATVAAHPDRVDAKSARALWLLEAGRFQEALEDSETLLSGSDPPPLAYWVRARVLLRRDQYAAAVADLQRLAGYQREAPFCAKAAAELLKQLGAR